MWGQTYGRKQSCTPGASCSSRREGFDLLEKVGGTWVVGTSDLRTDAPSSRPPHAAWSRPARARPSYTRTIFKTDRHLARTTTPRRSRGGGPAASYPRPEICRMICSRGRPPSKLKKSLIRVQRQLPTMGLTNAMRCKRPK